MGLHPSVVERLARLAADQRAAAMAPPAPVLCVAPAGSGKTTTLIARIAWLIGSGNAAPREIAAITFNTRAAQEMRERLDPALAPLGVEPGAVRVRTFHALGLEILRSMPGSLPELVDRDPILRSVAGSGDPVRVRRLDTLISQLKLDHQVTAEEVARDPQPGYVATTFVRYERALAEHGAMDFDDLIVRALHALRDSAALLNEWRQRCHHLLVDEAQDVDRSQLDLALLLAAPDNFAFFVGDDDQSIYGWRLADVRRVLGLAGALPGLRRVDLVTNYRCPRPVVERAVRLVEHNDERFAKRIAARPKATGSLVLAPDSRDEILRLGRVFDNWPNDNSTLAVLARTNRELVPAVALVIEREVPFRAARLPLVLEAPTLDAVLHAIERETPAAWPLLVRLGATRTRLLSEGRCVDVHADDRTEPDRRDGDAPSDLTDGPSGDADVFAPADIAAALLAWAPPFRDLAALADAVRDRRARLAQLRRDDARLTLATAHATKGLEFDHVAVIGLETGRFPSAKSLADAPDPARALEEERRLAYVAWTRARRSLTLVYDPTAASPFLREAFSANELGCPPEEA